MKKETERNEDKMKESKQKIRKQIRGEDREMNIHICKKI
jgi:hypothetical protein